MQCLPQREAAKARPASLLLSLKGRLQAERRTASSQPETLISDLAATTPTSSELSEPDEAPAAASGAKPKALPTALARPFARTQSAPVLSAVPKRVAPRKAPKSEDALPELSDDELPDAMSASLKPRSTCPPVSASQTIRGKRKAEELDSRCVERLGP